MRVLLSTLLALFAIPAFACSPRHINTPEELVKLADGIYHVRAGGFKAGPYPQLGGPTPRPSSQVSFTVIRTIKGPSRTKIQAPGMLSKRNDWNDNRVPYNFVRSEGRGGSCYASSFRLGKDYLIFLRNSTPYWAPLAATTEQVAGANDPWILWVSATLKAKGARGDNSFKPTPLHGTTLFGN